jgi:hypothetical protein
MVAYIAQHGITAAEYAHNVGISKSYISHIINANYDQVPAGSGKFVALKDQYFRKIAMGCGYAIDMVWGHFETTNYIVTHNACLEAKAGAKRVAINGYTGSGKTYCLTYFAQMHPKATYYIKVTSDMTTKEMLIELSAAMGIETKGSAYILRKNIVKKVLTMDKALIIFDEMETFKNSGLGGFKALCDELEGKCGIVVAGMELREKWAKNASKQKENFAQIQRRFAMSWHSMFEIKDFDYFLIFDFFGLECPRSRASIMKNIKEYDSLKTVMQIVHHMMEDSGSIGVEEVKAVISKYFNS